MNRPLPTRPSRSLTLALSVASLLLIAAGFTFSVRSSAAQTADTDGDGYADGVEQQLGSDPNDPESTPESFTLLWTCTDGNDNDRDGKLDFMDPGCRNTVAGSTPAPTVTPAPNGPSDSGTNPGGNGSGSDGGSTNGSSDGGGNAVLEGAGAPIAGTSGSGAGAGAASQTGTDAGQNSGDTTGANSDKSTDAGAAPGTGTDTAPRDTTADDGGGFPWKISLFILLLLLIAGLIAAGALAARSRRLAARNRY